VASGCEGREEVKYLGSFESLADVGREFDESEGFLTESALVVAAYEQGNCDGEAFVLFRHDGKLYEVNASHCSCYGLDGQWEPEETTVSALLARNTIVGFGDNETNREVVRIISSLKEEE
jgi:hypothetical protein